MTNRRKKAITKKFRGDKKNNCRKKKTNKQTTAKAAIIEIRGGSYRRI